MCFNARDFSGTSIIDFSRAFTGIPLQGLCNCSRISNCISSKMVLLLGILKNFILGFLQELFFGIPPEVQPLTPHGRTVESSLEPGIDARAGGKVAWIPAIRLDHLPAKTGTNKQL